MEPPPWKQDCIQRQQNEIEALMSIFMDDFQEVKPAPSVWQKSWAHPKKASTNTKTVDATTLNAQQSVTHFQLKLRPAKTSSRGLLDGDTGDQDPFSISMDVQFGPRYPVMDPPTVSLNTPGSSLTTLQINSISTKIRQRMAELKGQEMIFDVASLVQDALSDLEQQSSKEKGMIGSFYTTMMQRKEEADKEKELLAEKQREIKLAERNRIAAQDMESIHEEIQKKRLLVKEERNRQKKLEQQTLQSESGSSEQLSEQDGVRHSDAVHPKKKATEMLKTIQIAKINDPFTNFMKTQELPLSSRNQTAVSLMIDNTTTLPTADMNASAIILKDGSDSYPPAFSRYYNDFMEVEFLGKGGYGEVVKAQNRLDGRFYAVKKIRLDPKDDAYNRKILREVTTLSRLHHEYVVRYYQAWVETGGRGQPFDFEGESDESDRSTTSDVLESSLEKLNMNPDFTPAHELLDSDWISSRGHSSGHRYIRFGHSDDESSSTASSESSEEYTSSDDQEQLTVSKIKQGAQGRARSADRRSVGSSPLERILYIQMEYCEKNTLKDAIDAGLDEKECWRLFRQILEGLAYIHGQGMIHRDLKPINIFLDANGDVKIGDFGLATTRPDDSNAVSVAKMQISPPEEDSSLTSAVGTSFYIAPELLNTRRQAGGYNQKVDMYSLGIIFFECNYPLGTGMERASVLKNLRRPEIVFPSDFNQAKLSNQCHVIKWLLQHSPKDRPTALELMQSEYLPPKIEEEYVGEALRTIANPNTPYYTRLLSVLFSRSIDKRTDFTFDFNAAESRFEEIKSLVMSKVKEIAIKTFRRHSAVEFDTPLLLPSAKIHEGKHGFVRLLDHDGSLVELPYDLTVPFARWISRRNISLMKRWSIQRVFRENLTGGQPRAFEEADFDIVHSAPCNMVFDAEVIKVATEFLENLGIFSRKGFYLRINHGKIVTAILDHAGVPIEKRKSCCIAIQQLFVKQNWKLTKSQLLNQVQLSASSVKVLEKFCTLSGSLEHITEELNELNKNNEVTEALDELGKLGSLLRVLGIRIRLSFEPGLVYNYHYYQHGILFQILAISKRIDILAAGGRYDSLVMQYRHPSSYGQKIRAVGCNIALGKIASAIELDQNLLNSKAADSKSETKSSLFSRCLVYVASFGRISLEERLMLCNQLWKHNISAEFMTDESPNTIEDLQNYCREHNIQWLVILKEHGRWGANTAKIRNVIHYKQETDMRREEIIEFISSQMESGSRIDLALGHKPVKRERTVSSSSADGPTESSHSISSANSMNATVLNPPKIANKMKSGKKQLIADKAIRSISPFVDALTGVSAPSAPTATVSLLSHSPQNLGNIKPEIIALDLRTPVLRRIVECHDIFDEETFRKEVVEYHVQLKDYLQAIRAHIIDLKKSKGNAMKWIFLYSHVEDRWELLQLSKSYF